MFSTAVGIEARVLWFVDQSVFFTNGGIAFYLKE